MLLVRQDRPQVTAQCARLCVQLRLEFSKLRITISKLGVSKTDNTECKRSRWLTTRNLFFSWQAMHRNEQSLAGYGTEEDKTTARSGWNK